MARTLQLSQTETKTQGEGGEESRARKRQVWSGRDDEDNVVLTERQPLQSKDSLNKGRKSALIGCENSLGCHV